MQQRILAIIAGVNQADVANYKAGRYAYCSREKREKIEAVKDLTKTQALLRWMQMGNTVTPIQSLEFFGLHSLSQTVTKLRKQGHDIRNVGQGGPHDYAVYKLFSKEK